MNIVYDLPFGHGRPFDRNSNRLVNGFIGGWSFAPLIDISDGAPYPVIFSGYDPSGTGLVGGRADVIPGCKLVNTNPNERYLNINCFAVPGFAPGVTPPANAPP